jgi:outer membrane protein OmpA-like peptidoglycan-associated protein
VTKGLTVKTLAAFLLLNIVLSILLLSNAYALYESGTLTLMPDGGINVFDSALNLKTSPLLGLKADYGISTGTMGSIGIEGVANVTQLKSSSGNGDAAALFLTIGPLFSLPDIGRFTPLFTAGIGAMVASDSVNSMNELAPIMTVGIGSSYAISNKMIVRADFSRFFVMDLNGSSGFEMSMGLGFVFGSATKITPLVEKDPAPFAARRERVVREAGYVHAAPGVPGPHRTPASAAQASADVKPTLPEEAQSAIVSQQRAASGISTNTQPNIVPTAVPTQPDPKREPAPASEVLPAAKEAVPVQPEPVYRETVVPGSAAVKKAKSEAAATAVTIPVAGATPASVEEKPGNVSVTTITADPAQTATPARISSAPVTFAASLAPDAAQPVKMSSGAVAVESNHGGEEAPAAQVTGAVTAAEVAPTIVPAADTAPAPMTGKAETIKAVAVISDPDTPAAATAAPINEAGIPETDGTSIVIASRKDLPETPAPAAGSALTQSPVTAPAPETAPAAGKPENAPVIASPLAPASTPNPVESARQREKSENSVRWVSLAIAENAATTGDAGKKEYKESAGISVGPTILETAKPAVITIGKNLPEAAAATGTTVPLVTSTPGAAPAPSLGTADVRDATPVDSQPVTPSPATVYPAQAATVPAPALSDEAAPASAAQKPETAPTAAEAGRPETKEAVVTAMSQIMNQESPASVKETASVEETTPAVPKGSQEIKETGAGKETPRHLETAPEAAPIVEATSSKKKPESAAVSRGVKSGTAETVLFAGVYKAAPEAPAHMAESAAAPVPSPRPLAETQPAPVQGKAEDKEITPVVSAAVVTAPVQAAQENPAAQRGSASPKEELSSAGHEPSLRGLRNVNTFVTIEFDFGKSDLEPSCHDRLKKIAVLVKANPRLWIRITGHTDSIGSAHANYLLSQERARIVSNYLVKELGCDPRRISTKGYGYFQPVADNTTTEGRRKNRRAVTIVLTTQEVR